MLGDGGLPLASDERMAFVFYSGEERLEAHGHLGLRGEGWGGGRSSRRNVKTRT